MPTLLSIADIEAAFGPVYDPPLDADFYDTLPPILRLIDRVLQGTYTFNPRTLVREEKNKATPYHSSASNITMHVEKAQAKNAILMAAEPLLSREFSFKDFPESLIPWLLSDNERLKEFVTKFEPHADGTEPDLTTTISNAAWDIWFNPLKLTYDFVDLNTPDMAAYNAIVTRRCELRIAQIVEFTNGPTDQHVAILNDGAQNLLNNQHLAFLTSVLLSYLRPIKAV